MKFENNSLATIDYGLDAPYIQFPILSEIEFIKHGFSTRLGGVSEGIFSSMNLAMVSGGYEDNKDHVLENYKRISASMGIDDRQIVISKQLHNTNIKLVTKDDAGKGLYKERDFDNIDGFITNETGITLVTFYADCVPLFFVDKKNKAIGLSHAGWKGTVGKIGLKTVELMKEHFNSDPLDIISVIGPSICGGCYEVGSDVANQFIETFDLKPDNDVMIANGKGKYQCDLWNANKLVLNEAGLDHNHIIVSNVCTSCNDGLLFSHRKTGGKRGTLAAFLTLI